MSTGSSFGGSWVDAGLFFTIVVQGGIAVVFLLISLCFNSMESLKRIMRPARPHSTSARFLTRRDTAALFESDENEVAMRVSVFSAMQLLLLKYRTHIFLGGSFTAACLVVIFGTDTFINSYSFRNDSYDCKGRTSQDDCSGSGVCSWNSTGTGTCSPLRLTGLEELTILNTTPTHFRGWLVGIFTVAFNIWIGFCLIKMMVEMRALIFSSKTMPVQLHNEKLPTAAKSGATAVRVAITEEQSLTFDGSSSSLFQNELKAVSSLSSTLSNNDNSNNENNGDQQYGATDSTNNNTSEALRKAESPLKESVLLLTALLQDNTKECAVIYLPPEDAEDKIPLTDLILEEKLIIEEMKEYFAQKEKERSEKEAKEAEENEKNGKEGEEKNKKQEDGKKDTEEEEAQSGGCCGGDALPKLEIQLKEVQDKIKKLQTTSSKYEAKDEKKKDDDVQNSSLVNKKDEDKQNNNNNNLNPLAKLYSPWKVNETFFAIITFDTAANAAKFIELLRSVAKESSKTESSGGGGIKSDLYCEIAGPKSHVIYSHMSPNTFGNTIKTIILILVYVFFLFFASVIVAFFGSIDSLASIPGLGTVFGVVVEKIPGELFNILQAYLPVIALAIFQMLIPILIRALSESFRVGNWEQREASTFKWMFTYFFVTFVILQTALQGGISQLAGLISNPTIQDVLNFLVSAFSPRGGYFFAFIASSAVMSMLMQILQIGPVISGLLLAPREAQESKRLVNERPRLLLIDIPTTLWMVMFSLGMLFHSTSPLLVHFVCLYFVSSYYTFRYMYLDVQDRTHKNGNPSLDTSLSCAHATSQVKIILLLHSFSVIGTFIVFFLKFMWGAAALSSVCLLINFYLWSVKWSVLDPMLNTTDLVMIDHYDHLLSRRKTKKEDKKKEKKEPALEYLPPFASYELDENVVDSLRGKAEEQQQKLDDNDGVDPTTPEHADAPLPTAGAGLLE